MNIAIRLSVAVVPFLLTFLIAELLDGGEKDVFFVVPLLLWSVLFLCCHLVLWWRRFALGRSIAVSAGFATAVVAIAVVVLAVTWR